MSQQITNPEGAFGYGSTAGLAGNQRSNITVRRFRNMSTAAGVTPGQLVTWSTLIGDGNEVLPATTVGDGTLVGVAIAVTSASTNSNTTNQSSVHPRGAWFDGVVYGPAEAFVTSAVEKGDFLVNSASTLAPLSGGRLAPLTTAINGSAGRVHVIGRALTTLTSATTNRTRIFVAPQFLPTPTS